MLHTHTQHNSQHPTDDIDCDITLKIKTSYFVTSIRILNFPVTIMSPKMNVHFHTQTPTLRLFFIIIYFCKLLLCMAKLGC